jgi:hypothetical protein
MGFLVLSLLHVELAYVFCGKDNEIFQTEAHMVGTFIHLNTTWRILRRGVINPRAVQYCFISISRKQSSIKEFSTTRSES